MLCICFCMYVYKNMYTYIQCTCAFLKLVNTIYIYIYIYIYVYCGRDNQYSMIADHSPDKEDINFRLTSTGYLTGDLVMDLPPMKSVLIDPYNG